MRTTRSRFVAWVSVFSGVALVDVIGGGGWTWALWATGVWGAFTVVPRFWKLWEAGYSWRDVFLRPPAPDAAQARVSGGAARPMYLPAPTAEEFGRAVTDVQQVRGDRQAILKIMENLPKSERQMLPDVVDTVDKLLARAENLARMLHTMSGDVDNDAVDRLDQKIDAARRQPESAERERQLHLLERQRQALGDLVGRRQSVEGQLESCVLAMQNVRFDLLRLKSAGINAVLGDLTMATQQARSLSRDVDHAIAAAGEVRDLLADRPPPSPSPS